MLAIYQSALQIAIPLKASKNHNYSSLSGNANPVFNLAPANQPGSEVEIVLGLNRTAMTAPPGSLYAGILRLRDSLNLSQQDIPVSGWVANTAGLWVGGAAVTLVGQYLKSYAKADNPAELQAARIAAFDFANPPGTVWAPRASVQAWSAVASSAEGNALVAAVNPGGLFRSANYGVTWQSLNQSNTWRAIASSADGTRLVAVPRDRIYVSMNSGNHWTRRALSNDYSAVACSSDGSRMVATINGGGIVASSDFGTNWLARPAAGTARAWSGIACSSDGSRLVAVVNGGGIYTSADFGISWTLQSSAGTNLPWTSVASSADGSRLVAGASPGNLYTSTDFGVTWTLQAAAETHAWRGLASSGDGTRLVAVPKDKIYVSANSGNHWVRRSNSNDWSSVATSLDGRRSVAVVNGGYIWTSAQTTNYITVDTNSNLLIGANKAYIVTGTNTTLAPVPRPVPLRLILHDTGTGMDVKLLQRVYFGQRYATNVVIATTESVLDTATLGSARRISAPHLPFSHTNTPWQQVSGAMRLGSNLIFNVMLDYNDHTSNPFLHTFHPDHDNLKPDFRTVEPQGTESYAVVRQIALTFNPPADDFASLTAGSSTMTGTYSEIITISGRPGHSRQFRLSGTFALNRVSPIATLTTE